MKHADDTFVVAPPAEKGWTAFLLPFGGLIEDDRVPAFVAATG